jgi:uroporphyrinogen-III synthase
LKTLPEDFARPILPNTAPRTVIITRPAGQGTALSERLTAHGWKVLHVPALAIEFHADSALVRCALEGLPNVGLLHFASANAIAGWVRALKTINVEVNEVALRPDAILAVMGEGSRTELQQCWPSHGARVVTPGEEFNGNPGALDSETLLQTLDSMVARGATTPLMNNRALLIKGDGGRNAFADGLRSRGVALDFLSVYRRLPPSLSPGITEALQSADAPVLLLSSTEGAVAFGEMLDREVTLAGAWRNWRVLATHERVAQRARQLSCKSVLCVPPHDDAVVRAIESLT